MRRVPGLGGWVPLVLLLATGCAQIEPARLPDVPTTPAFRGADGPWVAAGTLDAAADLAGDSTWWHRFDHPELNRLQQQLLDASPDLATALARYQQSRAAADALGAARFPAITAGADASRNRQSERRPLRVLGPNSPDEYDSATLGLGIGYELDLWGRVRQRVDAGEAQAQAAQADFAAARLALQAQLAEQWVALRGVDADLALLRQTEAGFVRAIELIRARHQAGITSGLDLARADAQLDGTRSQLRQAQARRALLQNAIAALVGESASSFSLASRDTLGKLPMIPVGLPSALLQRRPDIAAAQSRVVAAQAGLGVARTAFFPSLTLGGQIGLQSGDLSRLVAAPNLFWALGPSLAATLFDGGRRRAEVARAEASLQEAGAQYRGTVLTAFQQVEDQLALLARLGEAADDEARAVAASTRALEMATSRWRDGAASYLEVVTAQTAVLQAQRSALDLQTRQRRASVQLVRALGGGWTPAAEQVASIP